MKVIRPLAALLFITTLKATLSPSPSTAPQEVEAVASRSIPAAIPHESRIKKVPSGNNALRDVSAHVCMEGMHEAGAGGGLCAVM